ncbi:hypothetical protein KCO_21032 [Pectobacterium brasiliense ICMP 19477]|nr:hypothetical protein KCO_21032 [Pectobacterium brasiliense ICMP 19477]
MKHGYFSLFIGDVGIVTRKFYTMTHAWQINAVEVLCCQKVQINMAQFHAVHIIDQNEACSLAAGCASF